MNAFELLPALAEIAVALLGFAAIVSVFQSRGSEWVPDGRFWLMLQLGLATLAFSLLPLPILASGAEPATCWTASSALFACFGLLMPIYAVRNFRNDRAQLPASASSAANYASFGLVMGGSLLSALLLVANAVLLQLFWPYLAALVWSAVITAYLFLRMMWIWLARD